MKSQPSEWEKIIANETTNKGLILKYISSSYKSTPGKKKTQSKKWAKKPKQTFLQRRHTDG